MFSNLLLAQADRQAWLSKIRSAHAWKNRAELIVSGHAAIEKRNIEFKKMTSPVKIRSVAVLAAWQSP
jgi:hypothetical protein